MQTFPKIYSCTHPREPEQLHPVFQQLRLAGEQAGEAGVFLRYAPVRVKRFKIGAVLSPTEASAGASFIYMYN